MRFKGQPRIQKTQHLHFLAAEPMLEKVVLPLQ
jgi:hypothetical protein